MSTRVDSGMSRDEKKRALLAIIREALNEQQNPTRTGYFPVAGYAFDSRVNQSYWRQTLGDIIKQTEALELLAEMVGVIDEEA
ncbi:hypothetical protein SEA_ROMAN_12 [Microbacterium phage Roman]|nr:hypothetical protein SEA_ROMAN_12 [Microbacterium phage Roman]